MNAIRYAAVAVAMLVGLNGPAYADEVEEALQMALEAYKSGDIDGAKEEVDFASQLINQLKAAGLSGYLPPALPGWTRAEDQDQSQAMAQFGGGMSVSATYTRENDRIEVQLMAGNQMVTTMAGMFGNAAMMGSMGTVKRLNRQKVVINQNGDVQAMIENSVFVQISGRAPVEDKEAYFEALDVRGLKDF